jgi:hypothetical protein
MFYTIPKFTLKEHKDDIWEFSLIILYWIPKFPLPRMIKMEFQSFLLGIELVDEKFNYMIDSENLTRMSRIFVKRNCFLLKRKKTQRNADY